MVANDDYATPVDGSARREHAAIAAYFWIGEVMGWRGIVGGLLLITGIIASQWSPDSKSAPVGVEPALS